MYQASTTGRSYPEVAITGADPIDGILLAIMPFKKETKGAIEVKRSNSIPPKSSIPAIDGKAFVPHRQEQAHSPFPSVELLPAGMVAAAQDEDWATLVVVAAAVSMDVGVVDMEVVEAMVIMVIMGADEAFAVAVEDVDKATDISVPIKAPHGSTHGSSTDSGTRSVLLYGH